ncbi:MAG: response regulator [Burkholderiaceae bacterium]
MEGSPARVLVLEDDPAVCRFVQLVLDALPIDLVVCPTLREARKHLAGAPVQVVLMDLTLPDGSGLELLDGLPCGAPDAVRRTVVFSGGVDAALQRQLEVRGVWRVLHKPASVGSLLACVTDALDSLPAATDTAPSIPSGADGDPVGLFFGGNRGLYEAYRQTCLDQFPKDLEEGGRAADAGDAPALRRVAHNLKSVLALLGEAQAAQQARSTEEFAAVGALEPMRKGWQQTCSLLRGLLAASERRR